MTRSEPRADDPPDMRVRREKRLRAQANGGAPVVEHEAAAERRGFVLALKIGPVLLIKELAVGQARHQHVDRRAHSVNKRAALAATTGRRALPTHSREIMAPNDEKTQTVKMISHF